MSIYRNIRPRGKRKSGRPATASIKKSYPAIKSKEQELLESIFPKKKGKCKMSETKQDTIRMLNVLKAQELPLTDIKEYVKQAKNIIASKSNSKVKYGKLFYEWDYDDGTRVNIIMPIYSSWTSKEFIINLKSIFIEFLHVFPKRFTKHFIIDPM